jgi:hypothetical protein
MSDYLTFSDLKTACAGALGDLANAARTVEIENAINQVYNELLFCDSLYPMFWLCRFDDSVNIKSRATITGITKATPPVVTAVAHGFADGDIVSIYGVSGMTEVNNRTFKVNKKAANTFELQDMEGTDIVGAGFGAVGTGGYTYHRGVSLASTNKTIQRILKDSVRITGYNDPLGVLTPFEVESESFWGEFPSRPEKIMHKKVFINAGTETDILLWFPIPDTSYSNLRYWLEYRPSPLSALNDVPNLPPHFHQAILAGVVTRLGENKAQVESGVIWPAIYKSWIGQLQSYNRKWWQENIEDQRSGPYLP